MNKDKDLTTLKRLTVLMGRVRPALRNFPTIEKFELCSDIRRTFQNALKYISLADSVKSKRITYLQEVDGYGKLP